MQNYNSKGGTLQLTAPAGGVVGGSPVQIGAGIFGVPVANAAAGDSFSLVTKGVFSDVPKATGAAWAEGDYLYWDNTAKNLTKTATNNLRVGVAVSAAASGDAVGAAKIGPVVG
ncbi:DUF2190 family protein [Rhodopseudomonas sp. BR0G17]|uniref:DUF2190 family protein n=1 Tax=Rhodopseudomonas sp. BR0G17 TaxID=2269368 RepID=UPI0013DE8612|nr:DUF2190 family protein [Rhodopseudomonas sp. BR0G17]NEW96639.1 DUF2190 family protein [Rhodopseudomonas sp. BR0G17]